MTDRRQQTRSTAAEIVAEGKGILAADESTKTMTNRLEGVGAESTEENRNSFRELLLTTPDVADQISGVILYDETIRAQTSTGAPFPELIAELGMIPGIKVDTGAKPLAFADDETVTEGLDGLRERLAEYRDLGARFAKWRAVIAIGDGRPTDNAIAVNAHALGRYAALCQEAGIAPIVEPEVLMDGEHSIERAEQVTGTVLEAVFSELASQGVELEGMILKPNMVLAGYDNPDQPDVEEVADRTVALFRRVVPEAVPGIAFLSGGQSDELATERLNAMNAIGDAPWELSFSYGRALQAAPLAAWRGDEANGAAAQAAFALRARLNSEARYGRYTAEMEQSEQPLAS